MVVIDVQKEILVMDSDEQMSLREERRRTGRYMAAGTAIFLSLLGVYQAVARGTPEYAALFAPALIMFIYVLWILYASKNQRKLQREHDAGAAEEILMLTTVQTAPSDNIEKVEMGSSDKEDHVYFNRSYSIA